LSQNTKHKVIRRWWSSHEILASLLRRKQQ
jgi:hypothetical protein